MTLLLDIAPYRPPASPATTGGAIYARFQAEPDTMAIAVVDEDGRPVGLVERNTFLAQMGAQYGHSLWAKRPITHVMNADPLVVDGDVTVAEFCGRILEERPSDLLHGFVVTCGGQYAGVGAGLALLQATASATATHAQEMGRLAREAQEALAAKERFLAVMSHEIRTPLNGVLAIAEIMRRKTRDLELLTFVDTILESGTVLLRLLNDALDLSRAEATGLELREEPLRLDTLLDEVRGLWAAQAELKDVRLSSAYAGPPRLWVLADHVRLRQVIDNLVGNALKFTGQGEVEVRLQTRLEGACAWLRVEVTDTGPGVPADQLEGIFSPFQQTAEGVLSGGAGLGLAVCRQIVERMNGRIWAENHAAGAMFTFEAPLYCVPEPEAAPRSGDSLELRAPCLHVLIADDNATNRLVAETLCEIAGCTTESVVNGAEAVEAARTGRFDLILMDVKMPVMDGVAATREIRSGADGCSQTPILALTANADPADAAFYRACGMNGVVEKPIKPERLLAAMNNLVALEPAEPLAGQAPPFPQAEPALGARPGA